MTRSHKSDQSRSRTMRKDKWKGSMESLRPRGHYCPFVFYGALGYSLMYDRIQEYKNR